MGKTPFSSGVCEAPVCRRQTGAECMEELYPSPLIQNPQILDDLEDALCHHGVGHPEETGDVRAGN